MRNRFLIALTLLAVLIFSQSLTGKPSADTLQPGSKVPTLVMADNTSLTDVSSLSGKYLLLNFWSSADGVSRIKAKEYDKAASELGASIRCVSVNLDRSEALFNEIVRRDQLDSLSQYHAEGELAKRIANDFKLRNNFCSYLIDAKGKIVAVNPTAEYLREVL